MNEIKMELKHLIRQGKLLNVLPSSRITIVGMALSGVAAAKVLVDAKAVVAITESKSHSLVAPQEEAMNKLGIETETGGHTDAFILKSDLIVVSPGVRTDIRVLERARNAGIPVISEVELAWQIHKEGIVAITGTNGKTTATSLCAHLLKPGRRPVMTAGNIGTPLCEAAAMMPDDGILVAEISSFQLESIDAFLPQTAALLNITPDHLDRYDGSIDEYADVKMKLFKNMNDTKTAIYNLDDPIAAKSFENVHCRKLAYSVKRKLKTGGCIIDGHFVLRDGDREIDLGPRGDFALPGFHNAGNALASGLLAWQMGADEKQMRTQMATFRGLPHRMEFVAEKAGIRYMNDSKATNVNSVQAALGGFHEPVILIMGGRDKGNDYSLLKQEIRRTVCHMILMGEASDLIAGDLRTVAPMTRVSNMDEAVQVAASLARTGQVVLLSPACSSFDQYENFEKRGEAFRHAVHNLAT